MAKDRWAGVFPTDGTVFTRPEGNDPLPGPEDIAEGTVAPTGYPVADAPKETVDRTDDVKEDAEKVTKQAKKDS